MDGRDFAFYYIYACVVVTHYVLAQINLHFLLYELVRVQRNSTSDSFSIFTTCNINGKHIILTKYY